MKNNGFMLALLAVLCTRSALAFGLAEDRSIIGGTIVKGPNDWIIGGDLVPETDPVLKSTVAVTSGNSLCTGSLIAKDIVVTAAHCVSNATEMSVVFTRDLAKSGVSAEVLGAIINPNYDPFGSKDNSDIAVLQIKGTLPRGYTSAAIMPTKTKLNNGQVVKLAGFGISNAFTHVGAGVLRKVNVNVRDSAFSRSEVTLDQTRGKGACHGDSGGPAFVITKTGQLQLWGVTSRGAPDDTADDCAHGAVYTKINSHRSFISKAMAQLRR
ncbi:MAG: trypsin-like serine protease [Bdellovibrionota bacterium]